MSSFWTAFVIVLVLANVIGALWLLQVFTKQKKTDAGAGGTTGHRWDGDLVEGNNPLPRWWLGLFWITAIFLVAYLVIYPGLGGLAGTLGWTQTRQYDDEVLAAEKKFGAVYQAFASVPLVELPRNPDAVRIGRNLFLNNCATCHGSDARGAKDFPNLTDNAWLYGGDPETIRQTITNGRTGVMPALGAALGPQGLDEVVGYVMSLSGRDSAGQETRAAGQQKFLQFCAACHGATAEGTAALGAPNLRDDDWLHGGTEADIRDVIQNGRINTMPAQGPRLGDDRIRTLVAYVLSLRSTDRE